MKHSIITIALCFISTLSLGMEICDNGVDDDNDGLIDLNDPDCVCQDELGDIQYIPNGDFESTLDCCFFNNFQDGECLLNWTPVNGSPEHIDPECYSDLTSEEESIGIKIDNKFIGLIYQDFNSFEFKETFGVCTNEPIIKDKFYKLEFDLVFTEHPEFDFGESNPYLIFYGLKDCNELQFTERTNDDLCELGFDLHPLDSIAFDQIPYSEWKSFSTNFSPTIDINALIIGYECGEDGLHGIKRFLFIDNIKLSELLTQAGFDSNINIFSRGALCNDDFSLHTSPVTGYNYQWYQNGIAIENASQHFLDIKKDTTSSGVYNLRVTNSFGCFLSDDIPISVIDESIDTVLCMGQSLKTSDSAYDEPGIYYDEISSEYKCANYTYNLAYDEIITGQTIVEIFEKGSSYSFANNSYSEQGTYEVLLKTDEGCDSLITLILSEIDYNITIPNIFTPQQSDNNHLTVYADNTSTEIVLRYIIYDRWGNQIFLKENFNPNIEDIGWNGMTNDRPAASGIYTCFAEVMFVTGEIKSIASPVLLLPGY